jgi:hypothetical protein
MRNANSPLISESCSERSLVLNSNSLTVSNIQKSVNVILNLRGECHGKELPENADAKASMGVLFPLEAFFLHYQLFQS